LWASLVGGGLVLSLPMALARLAPAAPLTRHIIAVAQMVFGAMLIHLTGGRIETHFYVFGSLAFLAFYHDPWTLVTASSVVAVDHLVRGLLVPESVFGVGGNQPWRWLEHA